MARRRSGLGIPEDEAKYYQSEVQQGRALVTVDAQCRNDEARTILLRDGAEDLQGRGFGSAPVVSSTASRTDVSGNETREDGSDDIRVPVREEALVVEKNLTEEGRVHIHMDVITEQQTVTVTLRQERVMVERLPFSGRDSGDDSFVERDIDAPVMGDDAVVGKRVAGVEEVVVARGAVTDVAEKCVVFLGTVHLRKSVWTGGRSLNVQLEHKEATIEHVFAEALGDTLMSDGPDVVLIPNFE